MTKCVSVMKPFTDGSILTQKTAAHFTLIYGAGGKSAAGKSDTAREDDSFPAVSGLPNGRSLSRAGNALVTGKAIRLRARRAVGISPLMLSVKAVI